MFISKTVAFTWVCMSPFCEIQGQYKENKNNIKKNGIDSWPFIESSCLWKTLHYGYFLISKNRVTVAKYSSANIAYWSANVQHKCLHSEAEFAVSQQKPTLSLLLEAGYKPNGWLGSVCANDILYDFSVAQNFHQEWSKLHAKLTEMKLNIGSCDTGSSVIRSYFEL